MVVLEYRRSEADVAGLQDLQDLKAVSAKIDGEVRKEDRKPFTVIIDEFADLAQEDFIGFLDRARSSKDVDCRESPGDFGFRADQPGVCFETYGEYSEPVRISTEESKVG